jgi:hypothetical protein
MPSFPHTLIGLGPFADQGCQIVFTKTAVSVINPDGHTILASGDSSSRLSHQACPCQRCVKIMMNRAHVEAQPIFQSCLQPT